MEALRLPSQAVLGDGFIGPSAQRFAGFGVERQGVVGNLGVLRTTTSSFLSMDVEAIEPM